ncbi:basic proline-rich protein-like [Cebus imitator]|uniref:basic proline-rich protein-like n=1 Tax=Cebus imitator TaxID=2715852 RepID=UPI000809B54F|nr:basic proline-rich protein-like [Cebus imitator]
MEVRTGPATEGPGDSSLPWILPPGTPQAPRGPSRLPPRGQLFSALGWSLQSRGSFEPCEVFCFGECWRGAPSASQGAALPAPPILLPLSPGVSATCIRAASRAAARRQPPAPLPDAPRDPRPRPAAGLGWRRARLRYRCLAAQPGRPPARPPPDQGPRPVPPRTSPPSGPAKCRPPPSLRRSVGSWKMLKSSWQKACEMRTSALLQGIIETIFYGAFSKSKPGTTGIFNPKVSPL